MLSAEKKVPPKFNEILENQPSTYINAFTAHSKQWASFFRAARLSNMVINDKRRIKTNITSENYFQILIRAFESHALIISKLTI